MVSASSSSKCGQERSPCLYQGSRSRAGPQGGTVVSLSILPLKVLCRFVYNLTRIHSPVLGSTLKGGGLTIIIYKVADQS